MTRHRAKCKNCSYEWTELCIDVSCPACTSREYDIIGKLQVVSMNYTGTNPLQWIDQKHREIESIVEEGYKFDKEEKGHLYFSK